MPESIIIIGAGASGLMAANELVSKNIPVIVLEARNRLGGRIYTIYDDLSGNPLELGAEFIHGKLPLSDKLINDAGLRRLKAGGEMWRVKDEQLEKAHELVDHWGLFRKKLKELKTDRTINEFLEENFSDDKYESLRESIRQYASGYDTADPEFASALALAREWLNEDEDEQYRTDKGYQHLVNYLAEEVVKKGGRIYTEKVVKEIVWLTNRVTAVTDKGEIFTGTKAILTVPISVLAAESQQEGAITFSPVLPMVSGAVKKMGMGAVIKVLLRFNEAFWKTDETKKRVGRSMEKMMFVFSGELIPTWWTQYPGTLPLLTGWLGGPAAKEMEHLSDDDILDAAITSVAAIFKVATEEIKSMLASWKVVNWTSDPYARGSYTYATMDTEIARKVLEVPVDNTLYFAGEALYDGPQMGTVEAALDSAKKVAVTVLQSL